MTETIANISGYVYAATMIAAFAYALVIYFRQRDTIPQSEIDAEARRLIVQYGDEAVEAAESQLLRSQWAKGKNDNRERAELVLKAVQISLGIKR